MTADRNGSAGAGAVVRKPPKNEPAGSEARLLTWRYGDLLALRVAAEGVGVGAGVIMPAGGADLALFDEG